MVETGILLAKGVTPEVPVFAGKPTSWLAVLLALRATALATGEQGLSRPPLSTAVIATKYQAPVESPVSLNVMTSLICGLFVGDTT
jgi:hypothetical protein